MIGEIFLIIGLVVLNGFFSLSEMALVSSRKARLRHESDLGKENYRLALAAADEPGKFLSSIQVAITLIGISMGAIGGATITKPLSEWLSAIPFFARVSSPLAVGIVVVMTTLVSVILGELVPKNLALAKPEAIAAAVIRPLSLLGFLFSPLIRFLAWTTTLIIRLFGISRSKNPEVTEDEVKILIAQGAEIGVFEHSERDMVEGVLDLDDRRVTSFMTPRPEVAVIDLFDDKLVVRDEVLANSKFAYIPVVEGDLDRVVGMLPVRAALAALASDPEFDIQKHLVQPILIPETISALKALSIMKDKPSRAALIVDEYGGVAGLVTLSDLLESVLAGLAPGDAEDTPGLVQREDGSYLVDGALTISEFADSLGIHDSEFASKDYDTVAGLVLDCMGSIPKVGEHCNWGGLRIEVMDMDGNRIDKLLCSVTNPVVDKEPARID